MAWMRTSGGHLLFAATLITFGVQGAIKGDFTVVWQPVPNGVPARAALVYLCALVSLASGIGLLWRRFAAEAARLLLSCLLLWLLLFRLRPLFVAPLIEGSWSFAETTVIIASAWVLYARFATDWDTRRLGFATGEKGTRIARVLYGLGMLPFGYAHFANIKGTADLVPVWLPGHVAVAYLTGATFVAAGLAVIAGVLARLAVALTALQMGLFTLLVWGPIIAAGSRNAFQWTEFGTSLVLTAAAWVVADSYRGTRWLAVGRQRATQ